MNAAAKTHSDSERRALLVLNERSFSVHSLPRVGEVLIGRAEECAVRINSPSVSRRHALLRLGSNVTIEDLGSDNGTRVHPLPAAASCGANQETLGQRQAMLIRAGEPVVIAFDQRVEVGSAILVLQGDADSAALADAAGAQPEAGFVVCDPAMVAIYRKVDQLARGAISVLIVGETGVGKEAIAETLWRRSTRVDKPFLRLNCGAFTETLLDSELFGHDRGAFTGAVAAKPGVFEAATGGTVFLDEVGELPATMQVKLLRVLEQGHVMRVGSVKPRAVDVRIVSATNCNLAREISAGRFREDLFYRINGVTLQVPPLRERPLEIESLAKAFLARFGGPDATITREALGVLRAYRWPGNVRELRNVIEQAVLFAAGGPVDLAQLPILPSSAHVAPAVDLGGDDERKRVVAALEACAWNQTRAAKLLGMSRGTLVARLESYGIPRPQKG